MTNGPFMQFEALAGMPGVAHRFTLRHPDVDVDAEREEVASTCALRLGIEIPVVVDRIDDGLASAYGALPDRLYLIGRGGHVAFQGEPGPFGFHPEDLERAIRTELAIPV